MAQNRNTLKQSRKPKSRGRKNMSTYRAIGARLANFALVTIQKLLGHAGVIVTRNKAAGIVPAVLRHAIGVTTRRPSLSRQVSARV
jgi:hypothetical protein